MFRNLLTAMLAFSLGGAAAATELGTESLTRGVGTIAGYAAQAVQDHVQSQLDWRSYYLDRMAIGDPHRARGEQVQMDQPFVDGH